MHLDDTYVLQQMSHKSASVIFSLSGGNAYSNGTVFAILEAHVLPLKIVAFSGTSFWMIFKIDYFIFN